MNKDNTAMHMDPMLAKELFAKGAVLVIAGVPVRTEFGIDLCSYTVGDKFRGVKMIPPGPHFVWCASQGPFGEAAPRVGFMHYFKTNEIVVREWDHDTEELRERQIDDPELEKQRIRKSLNQLEPLLAPYDYRYVSDWKKMIDCVTEAGVKRCIPRLGTIRTNVELLSCTDADRPRGGDKATPPNSNRSLSTQISKLHTDENDLLPDLKPVEGTAPRFTTLPERVPRNAEAADISRHAMDCIAAVQQIMQSFRNDTNAVIEELQLAFTFYLVGYSVEALAQWRKFLGLLCNSESAVNQYKLLYINYSEVLALQLPHLPEELMVATERNTVYKDVRSLLVNLYAGGLSVSAERFIKELRKKMQWQFDGLLEEDPEEQPVVIELETYE